MSAQLTIELLGLRFFGEHGMYDEERKVGNEFEMNISIQQKAPKKIITSLQDTINYAEVYRIAEEVFTVRKQLLETCAMEIAEKLEENFPSIRKINIQIKKLHPPITSFQGTVAVSFSKTYNK